jgi:hypothetical protein
MFCPLCLSEYRDGFTECTDCHIRLVASREQAELSPERFWKGHRQDFTDSILTALDSQGVPSHFKEIVNTAPQLSFLGIRLTPKKSTFEFEVWVLRSDLERARAAVIELKRWD